MSFCGDRESWKTRREQISANDYRGLVKSEVWILMYLPDNRGKAGILIRSKPISALCQVMVIRVMMFF